MKSLLLVLVLSAGIVPLQAQQEVDPDHFDQPRVVAATHKQSTQLAHKRHSSHRMLASRHSVKTHHHHLRRAV